MNLTISKIRYPLDLTGKSPNNLIENEFHQINYYQRIILPRAGAFYASSVSILADVYGNGGYRPLQYGVDYTFSRMVDEAVRLTGQDIPLFIRFTDSFVEERKTTAVGSSSVGNPSSDSALMQERENLNLMITYRCVGGEFQDTAEKTAELILQKQTDVRGMHYRDLIGLPESFTPHRHLTHIDDVFGLDWMKPLVQSLVDNSIGRRAREDKALWVKLFELRQKLKALDGINEDSISDINAKITALEVITDRPLVYQDEFRELNIQNDEKFAQLNGADQTQQTLIDNNQRDIEELGQRIQNTRSDILSEIAQIRQRISRSPTYTLNFNMDVPPDENYITLQQQGSDFTLNVVPDKKVADLAETVKQQNLRLNDLAQNGGASLSRLEGLEQRVETMQDNQVVISNTLDLHGQQLGEIDSTLAEIPTKLNQLNEKITEQNDQQVQDHTRINERLAKHETRLEELGNEIIDTRGELNRNLSDYQTMMQRGIDDNLALFEEDKNQQWDEINQLKGKVSELPEQIDAKLSERATSIEESVDRKIDEAKAYVDRALSGNSGFQNSVQDITNRLENNVNALREELNAKDEELTEKVERNRDLVEVATEANARQELAITAIKDQLSASETSRDELTQRVTANEALGQQQEERLSQHASDIQSIRESIEGTTSEITNVANTARSELQSSNRIHQQNIGGLRQRVIRGEENAQRIETAFQEADTALGQRIDELNNQLTSQSTSFEEGQQRQNDRLTALENKDRELEGGIVNLRTSVNEKIATKERESIERDDAIRTTLNEKETKINEKIEALRTAQEAQQSEQSGAHQRLAREIQNNLLAIQTLRSENADREADINSLFETTSRQGKDIQAIRDDLNARLQDATSGNEDVRTIAEQAKETALENQTKIEEIKAQQRDNLDSLTADIDGVRGQIGELEGTTEKQTNELRRQLQTLSEKTEAQQQEIDKWKEEEEKVVEGKIFIDYEDGNYLVKLRKDNGDPDITLGIKDHLTVSAFYDLNQISQIHQVNITTRQNENYDAYRAAIAGNYIIVIDPYRALLNRSNYPVTTTRIPSMEDIIRDEYVPYSSSAEWAYMLQKTLEYSQVTGLRWMFMMIRIEDRLHYALLNDEYQSYAKFKFIKKNDVLDVELLSMNKAEVDISNRINEDKFRRENDYNFLLNGRLIPNASRSGFIHWETYESGNSTATKLDHQRIRTTQGEKIKSSMEGLILTDVQMANRLYVNERILSFAETLVELTVSYSQNEYNANMRFALYECDEQGQFDSTRAIFFNESRYNDLIPVRFQGENDHTPLDRRKYFLHDLNLNDPTKRYRFGIVFRQINSPQQPFGYLTLTYARYGYKYNEGKIMVDPTDLMTLIKPDIQRAVNEYVMAQSTEPTEQWNLNNFRKQPGAEDWSSIEVDQEGNLQVTGVVLQQIGGGEATSVFAPSQTFEISTTQEWIVPRSLAGRKAEVIVRASSQSSNGQIIHSAVRRRFIVIPENARFSIVVGPMTSFGQFLSVNNNVDYPDALYPRSLGIPGSTVLNGLVTINV